MTTSWGTSTQTRLRQGVGDILARLQGSRTKVARRLADATRITDACGIPSQLKLLPPPLIGGYGHTLNIYQAALEEKLPFDFELPVQKVTDVVDQTIFACERLVEEVLRAYKDADHHIAGTQPRSSDSSASRRRSDAALNSCRSSSDQESDQSILRFGAS